MAPMTDGANADVSGAAEEAANRFGSERRRAPSRRVPDGNNLEGVVARGEPSQPARAFDVVPAPGPPATKAGWLLGWLPRGAPTTALAWK